jgi:hypothetical protein
MARTTSRPTPTATRTLQPLGRHCPLCGETMWAAYHNYRTITTLEDVVHLTLHIRRCLNRACPQFHRPYRPEEEGRLALPKHEFGLDVIAYAGTLRYAQHRSLPEIHQHLRSRGVAIALRTVMHLLERYDELLTLSLTDTARLQRITQAQGRGILALDGLQPDVGHEVLWVLRDCLSGEVLLARRLWSAPPLTSPSCSGACVKTCRGLWSASCRTANSPSAVPSRKCSPMGHTNCVTSMISARQRSRCMTPTAMPRKHAKSVSAGYAPWNGASQDGMILKLKWCGATVRPCGVPSRMMAAHPWTPRGSNSTTASRR